MFRPAAKRKELDMDIWYHVLWAVMVFFMSILADILVG
jgi:hypothetical protein